MDKMFLSLSLPLILFVLNSERLQQAATAVTVQLSGFSVNTLFVLGFLENVSVAKGCRLVAETTCFVSLTLLLFQSLKMLLNAIHYLSTND